MRPFSLALIGAGRIGTFHATALQASRSVRVTAVVEPRAELPDVVRANGAVHLRSVAELCRNGGVDGALVAVPTVHHGTVIGELAAAGVPILCEKPVGLDPEDVRAIGETARKAGVTLRVAFWRRFVPQLATIRERVRNGEFGEIAFVSSCQWDHVPPPAEFLNPASSGGIIVDCGVHDFDLLRWLTGQEVTAAAGIASDVWSIAPVPGDVETITLALKLSGGTAASVTLGRRHPPGELQELQVVGTRDAAFLRYVAADDDPAVLSAFRALVEDFARHVREGGPTRTGSIDDAVSALEAARVADHGVRTAAREKESTA